MKRLGLIGAGDIVQSHIDAALKTGFTPQVICGRKDSERARKVSLHNPGVVFARDLEELLEYELDALLIALPADIEMQVIEKCLEKNLPTLIEKPVSSDPTVLGRLVNLNLENVRVAYNRRFYSSVRSFQSSISSEPGFVQITIPELSTLKKSDSRIKAKSILENSVHIFDLLYFVFGKITLTKIRPVIVKGEPIAVNAEVEFAQGSAGNMSILFNVPENYSIRYWGNSKNMELCPIEIYKSCSQIELRPPTSRYPVKTYVKNLDFWNLSKEDQLLKPGFFEQYSDFYRFVNGYNVGSDLATLADALCALEIGLELVKSFNYS